MSSRGDITRDLSRRTESWLARRYHLWASEVYLSVYLPETARVALHGEVTPDIRPDYLAFTPYVANTVAMASWVERGKFTAIEVKSCMEDLASGHGLSFVGDENILVCPRELATKLVLGDKVPHDVDYILTPYGSGLRVAHEKRFHGGYRRFAASELLWAIVRTKRAHLARWADATVPSGDESRPDVTDFGYPAIIPELEYTDTCENACGKDGGFRCSLCGYSEPFPPAYCPNCGRKVVS